MNLEGIPWWAGCGCIILILLLLLAAAVWYAAQISMVGPAEYVTNVPVHLSQVCVIIIA